MTDKQKEIYNVYLKVLAEANKRPFKYRKDFTTIKDEIKDNLIKLDIFFERFDNIDIERFIKAPYKIWNDKNFYPIEFYNKRRALKAYSTYKKILLNLEPDDPENLELLLNGFKFIKSFCKRENIKIEDYITYKQGNYIFLEHLKDLKIVMYNLFCFDGFKQIYVNGVDGTDKNLLFKDTFSNFEFLYRKYQHSNKCKTASKKCLEILKKSLTSS